MGLGGGITVVQLLILLQPLSFASAYDPYSQPHHRNFHPSRIAVITTVILISVFFLSLFSIYLQRCSRRTSGNAPRRTALALRQKRGLDREVVESFPTMVYAEVRGIRKAAGGGQLECAVCLSEFGEAETLRLLPRCNHAFHPDCIDEWLVTHTTCPVCRADLAEGVQGNEKPEQGTASADNGTDLPAEAAAQQSSDCVVIVSVEEDTAPPTATAAADDCKTGRSKPSSWRSRSVAVGRYACWTEEDRERFTLRLPESVRTDLLLRMKGLTRSATIASYPVAARPAGVGTGRAGGADDRPDLGEGSSALGARERPEALRAGQWEPAAKSDRWAGLVGTPMPLNSVTYNGVRAHSPRS